jgi:hypothetical protein
VWISRKSRAAETARLDRSLSSVRSRFIFQSKRFFQKTLAQTLAAISRLHREAREIERSLHQHAAAERDPAMHGKLHRLHATVRDFCLAMPAGAP